MGIGAAAVGAVGGIAKTIMGAKQASEARKAIESYQRQELQNTFEGVTVSTLGADIQREEMARATSTGVEALRSAGTRGLIGGLGRLQQGVNLQSRQIGSDLDMQQQRIDMARAQDQVRVQGMQERREEGDLAGLGQQLATGQQNMYSGIGDISQIAGAAGGLMGGGLTPQVSAASSVTSAGLAPMQGGTISNPFAPNTNVFGRGLTSTASAY
jgi:hypothetical protein